MAIRAHVLRLRTPGYSWLQRICVVGFSWFVVMSNDVNAGKAESSMSQTQAGAAQGLCSNKMIRQQWDP